MCSSISRNSRNSRGYLCKLELQEFPSINIVGRFFYIDEFLTSCFTLVNHCYDFIMAYLVYTYHVLFIQAESYTEACGICGDVFVNKEDFLHHVSVMHPGQEVAATEVNVTRHTDGVVLIEDNNYKNIPETSLGTEINT